MHIGSLTFVDFLNFTVLIANDRDVFLSESGLLSELLLEGKSLSAVILFGLRLRLLLSERSVADLFTHSHVFKSNLLEFLLLPALV